MDRFALEPELVCLQFHVFFYVSLMSLYSWDLWAPSVWAGSYWTASLQYRALLTGAHLGRKIGRAESAFNFESRAKVILAYLQERYPFRLDPLTETVYLYRHSGTRRKAS
jgi:hypothetical protein